MESRGANEVMEFSGAESEHCSTPTRRTHAATALRNSTDSWHSAFRENSSKAAEISGILATW